MVKQLRQVVGVQRVEVVDFKQGVFAVMPRPGAKLSPDALMQAARRSGFTPDRVVAPGGAVTDAPVLSAEVRELERIRTQVAGELAAARAAFRAGNYERALTLAKELAGRLTDDPAAAETVRSKPPGESSRTSEPPNVRSIGLRRGEIQQFLSLVTFALGRYEESFEAAHAALHAVPPWDWKTLSGYYAKPDVYAAQLRELEASIRGESTAAKRFLIGYHYWMMGHHAAARTQLSKAAATAPDDKLIPELLRRLDRIIKQPGNPRLNAIPFN